jgi:hypothetical protein
LKSQQSKIKLLTRVRLQVGNYSVLHTAHHTLNGLGINAGDFLSIDRLALGISKQQVDRLMGKLSKE